MIAAAARAWLAGALLLLLAGTPMATATVSATDDTGARLVLQRPAARIVSLSPATTELLFAAGAGDRLVGVDESSDFPPEATRLARVGNSATVDVERVLALRPDLVVGWPHGAAQRQALQLRKLNVPVFLVDPKSLDGIGAVLESLGTIAGTQAGAHAAAGAFMARLASLRAKYAGAKPVPVFVQIWDTPLMTINDRSIMSNALRTCGGRNVFGAANQIAPTVNHEAVIAAAPAAVVIVAKPRDATRAIEQWRKAPRPDALGADRVFAIDPDILARATPRILDGVATLCTRLEAVRASTHGR